MLACLSFLAQENNSPLLTAALSQWERRRLETRAGKCRGEQQGGEEITATASDDEAGDGECVAAYLVSRLKTNSPSLTVPSSQGE